MERKIILFAVVFALLLNTTGCGNSGKNATVPNSENSSTSDEKTDTNSKTKKTMQININGTDYAIKLEDNEAVKKLTSELPIECEMRELNGNEKYVYLDFSLPTESIKPKRINAGDVMLFGDNCLVVFYKSFDTQYSYTKIGHIDFLKDLGNKDIKVKLHIQ